jgi:hypothetical protein
MTETVVTVASRWKRIALALICVVVALNLFVPPIGTSLAVNLLSAVIIAALIIVVTRGNPPARAIALGAVGVVCVFLAVQAAVS